MDLRREVVANIEAVTIGRSTDDPANAPQSAIEDEQLGRHPRAGLVGAQERIDVPTHHPLDHGDELRLVLSLKRDARAEDELVIATPHSLDLRRNEQVLLQQAHEDVVVQVRPGPIGGPTVMVTVDQQQPGGDRLQDMLADRLAGCSPASRDEYSNMDRFPPPALTRVSLGGQEAGEPQQATELEYTPLEPALRCC